MEAGKCVSYDDDIGPGWNHLVVRREKSRLTIHVNGKLVAQSSDFHSDDYDISNNEPLKIGFGEMDYFSGKIREVRLYNRALHDDEIRTQAVSIRLSAANFLPRELARASFRDARSI